MKNKIMTIKEKNFMKNQNFIQGGVAYKIKLWIMRNLESLLKN